MIHRSIVTLCLLFITSSTSLHTKNWTTISTNFKPTTEERQAQQDAVTTTQVHNLLHLSSPTSTSTSTSTPNPTTPPTLLLQQRMTLLRSRVTEAPKTMSAEEIQRNIASISAAKGSLAKMMNEVSDSIKNAETKFKEEKELKLHQLQEAKILKAATEVSTDYQIIQATENRVKARRKAINKCLHMIYGGSNKFYWHMRQVLSLVPPQKACSVLKNVDLPKLSLDGYTSSVYKTLNAPPPPTDGSTIIFFNTVKIPLFRCMCENVHMDPTTSTTTSSSSKDIVEMKDDAEMTAEAAEHELQRNERRSEPTLFLEMSDNGTNATADKAAVAWTTYSTTFKKDPILQQNKYDIKMKKQIHNLIHYMNIPSQNDNLVNISGTPIITKNEDETAFVQQAAPENAVKVDLSQLTDSESKVLLNHVNNQVDEAKKELSNLQQLVNQQEEQGRMNELKKLQDEKEKALRASLQTQLRSQLNGAMAARNTLDKCLEQLKVGGKPGKQWIRIRKLLAPTRPSDRCLVFKSFKFPVLRPWNYDPSQPPSTKSAELKAIILTCLCSKHPKTGHATIGMPVPATDPATDAENMTMNGNGTATEDATQTLDKLTNTVADDTTTTSSSSVLLEEEPELTPATETLDPKELALKLNKIEQDKVDVKNSMETVTKNLEKEEKSFNKERKFKKEKIKLTIMKNKSNEKALKMFEEISKMATKRRLALVRDCLKEIMGSGQNVLYWELRKLFAKTPMEAQCSVLKAFQFPILHMHGYTESIVNRKGVSSVNNEDTRPVAYQQLKVDAPANDGSMITEFGDGVKMSLFRCMCEERKMNDESETTNKVDEEKEENEGDDEEDGVNADGSGIVSNKEPVLKNKEEEKEVEKIKKEEAKVEKEEMQVEQDSVLKDLVD